MDGVGGVLAFFLSTGLVPPLVTGAVLSGVITWTARRRGWVSTPSGLAFAAVLSVVGILVFTVFRESVVVLQAIASGAPLDPPGWRGLRGWTPDGWWRATADPLGSTQVLLNGVLFVPAGFAWTIVTRRPWRVVLVLLALSVAIEVVQAVTGLGANDVADIVANVGGAVLGTVAAVVFGWVVDEAAGSGAGRRRWVVRGVGVAVVGVLLSVAPGVGAWQRQATLVDEATARFGGTTVADVKGWSREDQLVDHVWRGVLSVDADAFVLGDGWARARFPAGFFGARACVLVDWDVDGVLVQRDQGDTCTQTSLARPQADTPGPVPAGRVHRP